MVEHGNAPVTRSIYEDTNPRELKHLLQQIEQREAALPDFQRDFVWDPNATQELIVSIASNYPAGSLLRIRNTREHFACREFQGAPAVAGHKVTYLVLDGQQRLTSLYQAFFGVGEHRYYLDLGKLRNGGEFEDAIFHLRANHKRAKQLTDLAVQATELVLPLGVLRGGNGGYLGWVRSVIRHLRGTAEPDTIDALDDDLHTIGSTWIQTIDDYKFPVVTLSDDTGADAVCTIFETLNRTGVKLSPFELLTARFWPHDVNLRALWAEATAAGPIIEEFAVDPYYMMMAISLNARSAPSAKRSDVLNLRPEDVRTWWERTAWGMRTGLELLHEDCGVISSAWLPYHTILVPLTAILARHGLPGTVAEAGVRQRLARWYWCSVFGQRYESSPTSQMARDASDVIGWLEGGPEPESVAAFRFDPRMLRDITPRQRAVYRGVIGLVLRQRPRDFYKGAVITTEAMIEQGIDDHHVFPQAFLAAAFPSLPVRDRDCVLNRTLIDRRTNIRIGKRPPSAYLADVRQELGPKLDDLLCSHLLPAGPDSPLWRDDYAAFLDWRQDVVWDRIRDVTGVRHASDLLEDVADEDPAA